MKEIKKYNSAMQYAALGTQWAVLMLLAVWGGIKLDKKIGWRFPLLTVLLPLLALTISLWQLIKSFNKPRK